MSNHEEIEEILKSYDSVGSLGGAESKSPLDDLSGTNLFVEPALRASRAIAMAGVVAFSQPSAVEAQNMQAYVESKNEAITLGKIEQDEQQNQSVGYSTEVQIGKGQIPGATKFNNNVEPLKTLIYSDLVKYAGTYYSTPNGGGFVDGEQTVYLNFAPKNLTIPGNHRLQVEAVGPGWATYRDVDSKARYGYPSIGKYSAEGSFSAAGIYQDPTSLETSLVYLGYSGELVHDSVSRSPVEIPADANPKVLNGTVIFENKSKIYRYDPIMDRWASEQKQTVPTSPNKKAENKSGYSDLMKDGELVPLHPIYGPQGPGPSWLVSNESTPSMKPGESGLVKTESGYIRTGVIMDHARVRSVPDMRAAVVSVVVVGSPTKDNEGSYLPAVVQPDGKNGPVKQIRVRLPQGRSIFGYSTGGGLSEGSAGTLLNPDPTKGLTGPEWAAKLHYGDQVIITLYNQTYGWNTDWDKEIAPFAEANKTLLAARELPNQIGGFGDVYIP